MNITTVILDWAGTTVDYGCLAPVGAFQEAFNQAGYEPTLEEIRAWMGLPKRDHIAAILQNIGHDLADVDRIYALFESALFAVLPDYCEPLPGVVDAVTQLRAMGIRVGSTTGYTRAMMGVVVPLAARQGYAPDCVVCPDDTDGVGRPYPYMLWRGAHLLQAQAIQHVVKVGDTLADIHEGRNAGCISVGVLAGSSMVGLSRGEIAAMSQSEIAVSFAAAELAYREAGADFVIATIADLPGLIESLRSGGDLRVMSMTEFAPALAAIPA